MSQPTNLSADPIIPAQPQPTPTQPTSAMGAEQATDLTDRTKQGAGQVAETARQEAGNVASEAKQQARDLLDEGRREVRSQAATQQDRLARSLRSLAEELHSMAYSSEQQGLASDLARQGGERAHAVAGWLEQHEPEHLLQEVRTFAQRRPGAFLGLALGAGVLAGRLGRGLKEGPSDDGGTAQHRAEDGFAT
jgi:hypothetical protein